MRKKISIRLTLPRTVVRPYSAHKARRTLPERTTSPRSGYTTLLERSGPACKTSTISARSAGSGKNTDLVTEAVDALGGSGWRLAYSPFPRWSVRFNQYHDEHARGDVN